MPAKAEIISLYKNLGETPLECLSRFKEDHPEYRDAKMTYLGRLDPMAEGLLLVLVGDTRDKKAYLRLDKTYEFEALWGFETDTYDVLGLVTGVGPIPQRLDQRIGPLLTKISNLKSQKYPPYSSKSFRGDFLRARENRIEEAELEENRIKIFSIEHIHTGLENGDDILSNILERIDRVKGDFRQAEIKEKWEEVMEGRSRERFLISKFTADVSSGTYIRSLAHEMGKRLGTSALAYSIKRTRVGEYKV